MDCSRPAWLGRRGRSVPPTSSRNAPVLRHCRTCWNSCDIGCRGPSSPPPALAYSPCLSPGERSTTGASSCSSSIKCPMARMIRSTTRTSASISLRYAYVVIKNWMLLTLLLSALFAGAIYWVHGHIEYDAQRRSMSPTAITHGSVLLDFFFVVKAWSYGLDRYLLLYHDRSEERRVGNVC